MRRWFRWDELVFAAQPAPRKMSCAAQSIFAVERLGTDEAKGGPPTGLCARAEGVLGVFMILMQTICTLYFFRGNLFPDRPCYGVFGRLSVCVSLSTQPAVRRYRVYWWARLGAPVSPHPWCSGWLRTDVAPGFVVCTEVFLSLCFHGSFGDAPFAAHS